MPVSVEALVIIVLVVVPGLVAARTLRAENPSSLGSDRSAVFLALIFSVLLHLLLLPYTLSLVPEFVSFRAAVQEAIQKGQPASVGLSLIVWAIVVMFVAPVILGMLLSWLWRCDALRSFWRFLGLSVAQLTPSAWDWLFLSQKEGCWVIAELADGSMVGGEFGESSFASLSPNNKDIYLEKEYYVDVDHNFIEPIPDSIGVWVSGDKLQHLHLYRVTER